MPDGKHSFCKFLDEKFEHTSRKIINHAPKNGKLIIRTKRLLTKMMLV